MKALFLKSIFPLVALGVIGFFLFVSLAPDVTPKISTDMKFGMNEIEETAEKYLTDLGFDVAEMSRMATFRFDGETQLYLSVKMGNRTASEIIKADTLSTHNWQVWFYDPTLPPSQTQDEYIVWAAPTGRILGFAHTVKDTAPGQSLTEHEATTLAHGFLQKQGVTLAGYELETVSQRKLTRRTDYVFTWKQVDTLLGMDPSIMLRVQGGEIGYFRLNLAPKGDFKRDMSQIQTTVTFIFSIAYAATFLLFFYIVIFFLKKYHEGEVGVQTGLAVFLVLYAISLASNILAFPSTGAFVGMGDINKGNVRWIVFIFSTLIIAVFLQVMVFAGWSVGESYARSNWSKKLSGVDSLLHRKFFTLDVAGGITRGYAVGGILLGVLALVHFGLRQTGSWFAVFVPELSGIPNSMVPGLLVLTKAVWVAAFNEVVFRLFFISYFKEKIRKLWIGVIVSSLLFTLTCFAMWDLPFGFPNLEVCFAIYFLVGVSFSLIYIRWDLLTTLTASFVVLAVGYALPIFSSTGAYFETQQLIVLIGFVVPLLIAAGGFMKREVFEFTGQTMPKHILRITERERMAKELEIARNVQLSLLPKTNPLVEGYDIAGICIPAFEVGGDYYDFVHLANGKIGIAIGDVSGKGVPAAIYMTLTKGILQSHAEENISPREVLSKVNKLMYRTIDRHSFVSMFYAILDTKNHSIRFARAGHNPAILAGRLGGGHEYLIPAGLALGLDEGGKFNAVLEERETPLRSGDLLVLYTDGFVEAVKRDGSEFGEERLAHTIIKNRMKSSSDIIQAILRDVKNFIGDFPQRDDMTMVVVKVV